MNKPLIEAAKAAAPAFRRMGWEWRDEGVPSEDAIRQCLQSLKDAVEGHKGTASTGRLHVEWQEEDGWQGYHYWLDLGDDMRWVGGSSDV